MFGDWKCDCKSSTLVDSAFAGSQAFASFFSAPMSFPDSGKATTSTTTQKPRTSHLVQLPAGISEILLPMLIWFPRMLRAHSSPIRNHGRQRGRKGAQGGARGTPGGERAPVGAEAAG